LPSPLFDWSFGIGLFLDSNVETQPLSENNGHCIHITEELTVRTR
jgi:hypothetical protein